MEDIQKILPAQEFLCDIKSPDMLFALLVKSTQDRGHIQSIRTQDPLPEGYFLFWAKDVIGQNYIQVMKEKIPIFATDVSFCGECIGLLVGKDKKMLRYLNSTIKVVYKERGEYSVSKTVAKRTVATKDFDESIFESKDIVTLEKTYRYDIQKEMTLQKNGAFCKYKNGALTVYTMTKWTSNLLDNLSSCLKIKTDKITIRKTNTGFDDSPRLQDVTLICCRAALASALSGLPVKLVEEEKEEKLSLQDSLCVKIKHKTAVTKQGKIVAAKIDILYDVGAFCPFAVEFCDLLSLSCFGVYSCDNFFVETVIEESRKPYSVLNAEQVEQASFFAIENQMNLVARVLRLSPLVVRTLNMNDDKKTFPFCLDLQNARLVLEQMNLLCDYSRKYASNTLNTIDMKKKENTPLCLFIEKARGMGLSCCFSGDVFLGSSTLKARQSMQVCLEASGKVVMKSPVKSFVIAQIWKELCASILKIEKDMVTFDYDSQFCHDLPDDFSCNISIMTKLLKRSCIAIEKKRFINPLPIKVSKSLTPKERNVWNAQDFCGKPFYSTSFATCAVDLRLDTLAFTPEVKKIYFVIDCGKLLDTKTATNCVRLAVQKTISQIAPALQTQPPDIIVHFFQTQREPARLGHVVENLLPSCFVEALLFCVLQVLENQEKPDPSIDADSEIHNILQKEDILKSLEACLCPSCYAAMKDLLEENDTKDSAQ